MIKKIGIMASGGDSPGMNAAIRSLVRCAIYQGLKVDGVIRGYQGLIDGEIVSFNHRSVSNIINRGGTILKTARSAAFLTKAGQKKAVANLKKHKIDALMVIGGDGSYRGAKTLWENWKIPTIGLPGTIDNDLYGTDQTIGTQTAVNTALESIDKIRDTAQSMERIFVIEVIGNKSGYIALEVALGAGAEEVIIPERKFHYNVLCKNIVQGHKKGKISWMIVVAEGAGRAEVIADTITRRTGLETRYVVLGHVQRGGTPVASDRILASRLGAAAIDLILKGQYAKAVGVWGNKIQVVDLGQACKCEPFKIDEYYQLIKMLI